jgi:glycosyl transferase family 11
MKVVLRGGLGNQLFGYAFGRSVSLARNEECFFVKDCLGPRRHRDYYLDRFNTKIQLTDDRTGLHYGESVFKFDPGVFTAPVESFFDGYWQSERYFNPDALREDLQFKEIPNSSKVQEVAEKIRQFENSCFIHVRRSDYTREPHLSYHGLMEPKYYMAAIDLICKLHQDVQFFVFSDDVNWSASAFPGYTIVEGTDMFEDLYLMTQCRHAILANSSFGWWGAWLNARTDKTVIAPKEWFRDPNACYDDIVPESWVKI